MGTRPDRGAEKTRRVVEVAVMKQPAMRPRLRWYSSAALCDSIEYLEQRQDAVARVEAMKESEWSGRIVDMNAGGWASALSLVWHAGAGARTPRFFIRCRQAQVKVPEGTCRGERVGMVR